MPSPTGRKCRLALMFALTLSLFLAEVIVGHLTNSTALVADSFHMLNDVAALVVAYLAVRMTPLKWSQNTFGWARAEVLGALVNAVFLATMCFALLIEALKRSVLVLYYGHDKDRKRADMFLLLTQKKSVRRFSSNMYKRE